MADRAYLPWRIAGAYLESCNCDAICPCRTIDGVPGGRSTHGVCFGALCWRIDEGYAADLDLSGLNAALVHWYSDDEDGSPWQFIVHVDERGDEGQRDALAGILVGKLGGELILALPWVRKPSELLDVRASRIEIEHGERAHTLQVGDAVRLRVSQPMETEQHVSCIVPGHHQPGREHLADEEVVRDGPFSWELAGKCAFVSVFDYRSDES